MIQSLLMLTLGALSPTSLAAMVFVLSSGGRRYLRGLSLVLGAATVLAILCLVVIVFNNGAEMESRLQGPHIANRLMFIAGLGLIFTSAAIALHIRRKGPEDPLAPAPENQQFSRLSDASYSELFAIGLGWQLIKFRQLFLMVVAIQVVASLSYRLLPQLVFALVAMLLVLLSYLLPLLLTLLVPSRSDEILADLSRWTKHYGPWLAVGILGGVGAFLIVSVLA